MRAGTEGPKRPMPSARLPSFAPPLQRPRTGLPLPPSPRRQHSRGTASPLRAVSTSNCARLGATARVWSASWSQPPPTHTGHRAAGACAANRSHASAGLRVLATRTRGCTSDRGRREGERAVLAALRGTPISSVPTSVGTRQGPSAVQSAATLPLPARCAPQTRRRRGRSRGRGVATPQVRYACLHAAIDVRLEPAPSACIVVDSRESGGGAARGSGRVLQPRGCDRGR